MSEAIYRQVEDAIQRKLHLGGMRKGTCGGADRMHWWRPVRIVYGDIMIVTSDCGRDRDAYPITLDQWANRVKTYGLWRRIGVWNFVRADDPAAFCIAYARYFPNAAGQELYELRKKLAEIDN